MAISPVCVCVSQHVVLTSRHASPKSLAVSPAESLFLNPERPPANVPSRTVRRGMATEASPSEVAFCAAFWDEIMR